MEFQLIEKIFNEVNLEAKIIKVSPNLSLDLSNLTNLKEASDEIAAKVSELQKEVVDKGIDVIDLIEAGYDVLVPTLLDGLVSECSVIQFFEKKINEGSKTEDDWQEYVDYANQHGFFLHAASISWILSNFVIEEDMPPQLEPKKEDYEGFSFNVFKEYGIIKTNTDLTLQEALNEFSVKSQVSKYNLSSYEGIVIGCMKGTEDRSLIDSIHTCNQAHDKDFVVDLTGDAQNADLVGFDALNIEHWKVIEEALGGRKVDYIIDHTNELWGYEEITVECYEAELQELYSAAQYIKEHILSENGEIYCYNISHPFFGFDGGVKNTPLSIPINPVYYTGVLSEELKVEVGGAGTDANTDLN